MVIILSDKNIVLLENNWHLHLLICTLTINYQLFLANYIKLGVKKIQDLNKSLSINNVRVRLTLNNSHSEKPQGY